MTKHYSVLVLGIYVISGCYYIIKLKRVYVIVITAQAQCGMEKWLYISIIIYISCYSLNYLQLRYTDICQFSSRLGCLH